MTAHAASDPDAAVEAFMATTAGTLDWMSATGGSFTRSNPPKAKLSWLDRRSSSEVSCVSTSGSDSTCGQRTCRPLTPLHSGHVGLLCTAGCSMESSDLDKGMAEAVGPEMPSPATIATCNWLPDDELRASSMEFGRTMFQGGLNGYRVRGIGGDPAGLRLF